MKKSPNFAIRLSDCLAAQTTPLLAMESLLQYWRMLKEMFLVMAVQGITVLFGWLIENSKTAHRSLVTLLMENFPRSPKMPRFARQKLQRTDGTTLPMALRI
jgi:hypothetical protein